MTTLNQFVETLNHYELTSEEQISLLYTYLHNLEPEGLYKIAIAIFVTDLLMEIIDEVIIK